MDPQTAFVGLGSNLGDRLCNLRSGVAGLRAGAGIVSVRCSAVYDTDPVGPPQPDFLNAAAEVRTTLGPLELLALLKRIESRAGREAGERWGPRVLDLDLLLYGSLVTSGDWLVLPHPELAGRAFVLVGLADLAPDLDVPGAGRVADLLFAAGRDGVRHAHPPDVLGERAQG